MADTPDDTEIGWGAEKVVDYLLSCGAALIIGEWGGPSVVFPADCPKDVRAVVIPHLSPNRCELIEYIAGFGSLARKNKARADRAKNRELAGGLGKNPKEERKRIIREAVTRGTQSNKVVLFLKRNGLAVTFKEKPERRKLKYPRIMKIKVTIEREATHVCVTGDTEWTPLPKVTTHIEDTAIAPKKRKKKRES